MLDRDGGLLHGTLDVLILKALTWGPRHGYSIAEWVNAITDGDVLIALAVALAATLLAGLYPTWRALQVQPALQLKTL